MDAFAVSLAVGARIERLSFRPLFRLSFHFGLFQFMMPILGWFLGRQIEFIVSSFGHWVAFALLLAIGGKMVYESFSREARLKSRADPTRKWLLIMLSIATSIDALAVGFSIALLNVHVLTASVIIGIVAAGMTLIGMFFGKKLGALFGRRMELLGGLILIGIGIKTLVENL